MEGAVRVKEEESEHSQPQPREGLNDASPPPFLTKTFDMVDDSSIDSIVSWSITRNSFVVWDPHSFSTTILPRYFKHSNFSSFIRQLNTYGFRKVDPDRWEFANEGFLAGQKHLLKTIKRRRNVSQGTQQRGGGGPCLELGEYGLEGEVERLRRDRNVLMAEIVKLRQQQHNSRNEVLLMETRLQATEKKQQQMMTFLAKALNNPSFMQHLADKNSQNTQLFGVEVKRKRRLTASPNVDPVTSVAAVPIESVVEDYRNHEQELANIEFEMDTFFATSYDTEPNDENNDPASTTSVSGDTILEDFLKEDLVTGNPQDEVVIGDCSRTDIPAEDLAATPKDWTEELQDLVNHMGYLGSKP
ncbi:heat stress transcription factor A-2 [Arachis ipaensis]|uniref:heat stress transcription factor A-2 n=1 Tax=Arachis ipaensis TaxID=130454 RepID=UPI0007AF2217|nr:heat stress transcription factor A-2 [Arachis ipaensis]XP_016162868.1 heat stress transcription factor A-2 [Arachis ipaensis]XP_020960904.1 heat stress transcription factor A-2 [Arachis ipaensis]